MRPALPALAAAVALCLAGSVVTGCSAAAPTGHVHARHNKPPASYYLALGDSLSQGVQPDSSGASVKTPDGYASQLYTALRKDDPGLRLTDLGCPGETTATMIHGGACSYRDTSQLAAAVGFLRAHQGHVVLITPTSAPTTSTPGPSTPASSSSCHASANPWRAPARTSPRSWRPCVP